MAEKVTIGNCELWHGDCREVLPLLPKNAAIVSDPPYGMAWVQVSPAQGKHSKNGGGRTGGSTSKHYGATITNDSEPFDPTHLLGWPYVILWGSNHYSNKLPKGAALVWIKKAESCWGAFLSDAELAWAKPGVGVYCFRDYSTGQADARRGLRAHPNQKPTSLMQWCVQRTPEYMPVIDAYMGSGATGLACVEMGRPFYGIEIERRWFDAACERIDRALAQPRLFEDAKVGAGDTAVQGDMLLPANV